MNRREFLISSAVAGASVIVKRAEAGLFGSDDDKHKALLKDMLIIDPHQHPDMDSDIWKDQSASYKNMKSIGLAAGCFSAVGDHHNSPYKKNAGKSAYELTKIQLDWWHEGIISDGKVKVVHNTSEIPQPGSKIPGAILGIEGGDALEGKKERVDEFYKMGVRIITIMHYHNNEIGDIMAVRGGSNPGPFRGGLSNEGREIINRMQEIGMAVDVAHAEKKCLRQIAEMSQRPLIDSHTALCTRKTHCGRSRTPWEMDIVAKTGGIVCTWPAGWSRSPQKSFFDWTDELLIMKKNIGIEHMAIGTDDGGYLSSTVSGYSDVRDLGKLAASMLEKGFTRSEIAAFMGGNSLRVLKACIG